MSGSKYFGGFLVEKKIITAEQLVGALITQAGELPTTMQVVYEARLLNADQWLKVLEHQASARSEFRTACVSLGFWNQTMEETLQSALGKKRTPLGQVLLKMQATDIVTLTKALDEFLASAKASNDSKPTTSAPKTPTPAASAATGASVSDELSGIKLDFHQIDEALIGDFSDFFSANRLAEMTGKMRKAGVPTESGRISETIGDLATEAHTLKGVAVCLRLSLTTILLDHLEKQLVRIGKADSTPRQSDVDACVGLVELLSKIREKLIKDKSEEPFWRESGASVQELMKKLA